MQHIITQAWGCLSHMVELVVIIMKTFKIPQVIKFFNGIIMQLGQVPGFHLPQVK